MSECNHDWDLPAWSKPKCVHCGMRKQDFDRIAELEADRDDQAVKNYEQAKRIAELKEKLHQRGQVIAAHISIDDLQTSWDRIIVAECIREQGDE